MNFDHVYNPSFFFFPTHLRYSLHYERTDRERRRQIGRRTGEIPARLCPTAKTYRDHQVKGGVEGAELGGLYTRLVIYDFLPQYPGRAPFRPGFSEFGATKAWTGSPMASLQRAVLMLGRLNLHGIPREIRDDLRQLQDAYSEGIFLEGSERDIESSESEEGANAIRSRKFHEENRGSTFPQLQQSAPEQRDTMKSSHQNDKDHALDKQNSICTSNDNSCLEEVIQSNRYHKPHRKSSWLWGPSATSEDAANFSRG